jgi:7-keto-8-aminopelargonate synthetase-like enzyme
MLGEVDIVIGAFSKTFASNGGFVLVRDCNSLKYLRVYSTSQLFSNALSPIQTTVIQASMRVSLSDEGGKRRRSLFRNAVLLRKALSDGGLSCLGRASPIIPVEVGSEFEVRLAHRLSGATGVLVNMAEYPVVPRGKARFRLQVQSAHTKTQITTAAARILDAVNQAKHHCRQLETTNNGGDHV